VIVGGGDAGVVAVDPVESVPALFARRQAATGSDHDLFLSTRLFAGWPEL